MSQSKVKQYRRTIKRIHNRETKQTIHNILETIYKMGFKERLKICLRIMIKGNTMGDLIFGRSQKRTDTR